MFSQVCSFTVPGSFQGFFPRSLVPGPFLGGTPVPGSFPGHWYQVLSRGYPTPGWGYPVPDWGYPGQVRMGYPQQGLDGVLPQPGQDGVPLQPELGWPPWPGLGYPPSWAGLGHPASARSGWGSPHPGQNSRVSTCYTAGSMPLAVMQDDLLVFNITSVVTRSRKYSWGICFPCWPIPPPGLFSTPCPCDTTMTQSLQDQWTFVMIKHTRQ